MLCVIQNFLLAPTLNQFHRTDHWESKSNFWPLRFTSRKRVDGELFGTWVEEDNGLECRVLVFVYLNVLEGLNQLVQHSAGDPGELRFRTVPVDHTAVACRYTQSEVFNCPEGLRLKGWWNCVVFYRVPFGFQETLWGRSFTSKNVERGRAHMGVSTRQISWQYNVGTRPSNEQRYLQDKFCGHNETKSSS